MRANVFVIGAGTVGAAIVHGLVSCELRMAGLDGFDREHRAGRANFDPLRLYKKGLTAPGPLLVTASNPRVSRPVMLEIPAEGHTNTARQTGGQLAALHGAP